MKIPRDPFIKRASSSRRALIKRLRSRNISRDNAIFSPKITHPTRSIKKIRTKKMGRGRERRIETTTTTKEKESSSARRLRNFDPAEGREKKGRRRRDTKNRPDEDEQKPDGARQVGKSWFCEPRFFRYPSSFFFFFRGSLRAESSGRVMMFYAWNEDVRLNCKGGRLL